MPNTAREIIEIRATVPKEEIKLRVAAYARVSSDSEEQLNSFSNQMTYYTKLVEEKKVWELVDVYADEGISGVSAKKRTEFQRLLEDCRDGKIDRVITKSVSRFARNTIDSITALRELKSLGVSVLFEKEGIDTEKITSENLVTLYSNFAQEESMNISKNCKKGIRMRMKQGTYKVSNPPFGYFLQDGEMMVNQAEAEVVQRIFREYLQGKGSVEIAKQLTMEEIPRKDGKKVWNDTGITYILRNEKYKGDCLWQKKFNQDILPYKQVKNEGDLPQYYVKETHESIIPEIQYELVNLLLKERGKNVVTLRHTSPLSQKIRCSNCGAVYRYRKTRNKIYWVCRTHDESAKNCKGQRIPEEKIHRAFVNLYNKLRNNYKEILVPLQEGLEELQIQGARHSEEIQEINQRIAEISEQNLNLSGLMAQGILDSALFIPQIDALKVEMDKLKWQKKRLVGKLTSDDSPDKLSEVIAFLERSPKTISKFEGEFFDEMVENILAFDKEKITFVLYGGLKLEERL
ncbi:MAG: recombinase family protein [Eubacteriales bacterium]